MPYCPKCGTMADGNFCPACGSAIGAPAPPPQQQYSAPPPAGPAAAGMTDNMACALCYILGLITGVLFLVLAPYNQNPRVKFHAWQSILFNVAWIAFTIALGIVTPILSILSALLWPLVGLAGFLFWLFLMWKAYSGENFEIPVIGPFARQQAGF